jgi:putative copper resistance protein D
MKSLAASAGVLLFALLFSTATLTMGQQSQTIKKVPIQTTSAASGEKMFNAYCAVCHGKDGKGNGPAVPALKVPPPDLTTLAQRHDGKFPTDYVGDLLRNGIEDVKAHGSKDMPIWGPLFGSISGGVASPQTQQRIHNVTEYIESLQAK